MCGLLAAMHHHLFCLERIKARAGHELLEPLGGEIREHGYLLFEEVRRINHHHMRYVKTLAAQPGFTVGPWSHNVEGTGGWQRRQPVSSAWQFVNLFDPDDFAGALPAIGSAERAAQGADVWSGRLDEQAGEMHELARAK